MITPPADPPPKSSRDDPRGPATEREDGGRSDSAGRSAAPGCGVFTLFSVVAIAGCLISAVIFVRHVAGEFGKAMEGMGEAIASAVTAAGDVRALREEVAVPAPPPVAGTAEQAAALGEALAAAVAADDADAALALVDRGSLLRGLLPEPWLAAYSRVPAAESLPDATSPPPGALGAVLYQGAALRALFDLASPPEGAVTAEGVTEINGLPAAAFTVTAPLPVYRTDGAREPNGEGDQMNEGASGAEPAPRTVTFRVFLIPGPDGRVAAISLEDYPTPGRPGGETFTGSYAEALRLILAYLIGEIDAGRLPAGPLTEQPAEPAPRSTASPTGDDEPDGPPDGAAAGGGGR